LNPVGAAPHIDNQFALVPKLLLGNPEGEALGNRSCVALPPASMQVVASRDGKLELPEPSSQAGAWELAKTRIGFEFKDAIITELLPN